MICTVKAAFESANIQDMTLSFPSEVESTVYKKVKRMLTDIGGNWEGGKNQRFVFPCSISPIVSAYLDTNSWPKKNPYALFPTPQEVIEYIFQWTAANPERWDLGRTIRILEPSAGRGNIADEIVNRFNALGIQVDLVCVELDPINAQILRDKGYTVYEQDFLTFTDETPFDLITMNPPFLGNTYAKHILHAQTLLQRYGDLVAVLPTTLFQPKNDKTLCALKEKVTAFNNGQIKEDIFDGNTFKDTNYETCVVGLMSESESKRYLPQYIDAAANNLVLALTNDADKNRAMRQCEKLENFDEAFDRLITSYIKENPYNHCCSKTIDSAKKILIETLELETIDSDESQANQLIDYINERQSMVVDIKSCTQQRRFTRLLTVAKSKFMTDKPMSHISDQAFSIACKKLADWCTFTTTPTETTKKPTSKKKKTNSPRVSTEIQLELSLF